VSSETGPSGEIAAAAWQPERSLQYGTWKVTALIGT
jgi:hypothetical protein